MGKIYTDKNGYPRWKDTGALVHRSVAAKKIGRPLRDYEVVHHQDGDKTNFRKENLSSMSRSFHSKLEAKKRKWSLW
jgi:hypothetical protein